MNTIYLTAKQLRSHLKDSQIYYTYLNTPAGLLFALSTEKGIFQATFVEEKRVFPEYREIYTLNNTLILAGTEFQIKVWKALLQIPSGNTTFYAQLAHIIGYPKAYRAVANAVGDNKIAYLVPCHRVIRKAGDICGYNWGIEKKRTLLSAEKK
ncbi:MAG TPA: MGMT family protein [Candidatus Babeliales bacterium]|nr:MGMT family protein [Candidatus Babeliales bacterium]